MPSGNAVIEERVTFVNGLVRSLTGFVYGPTIVRIWCGSGAAAEVELSPEDMTEIARSPETLAWVETFDERLVVELANAQTASLGRPLQRDVELAGKQPWPSPGR